jgi:cytochrome c1
VITKSELFVMDRKVAAVSYYVSIKKLPRAVNTSFTTPPENATKNSEATQPFTRAVEEKSRALIAYLDVLKENKTTLSIEERKQMIEGYWTPLAAKNSAGH